jgi:hypothetical protein
METAKTRWQKRVFAVIIWGESVLTAAANVEGETIRRRIAGLDGSVYKFRLNFAYFQSEKRKSRKKLKETGI